MNGAQGRHGRCCRCQAAQRALPRIRAANPRQTLIGYQLDISPRCATRMLPAICACGSARLLVSAQPLRLPRERLDRQPVALGLHSGRVRSTYRLQLTICPPQPDHTTKQALSAAVALCARQAFRPVLSQKDAPMARMGVPPTPSESGRLFLVVHRPSNTRDAHRWRFSALTRETARGPARRKPVNALSTDH